MAYGPMNACEEARVDNLRGIAVDDRLLVLVRGVRFVRCDELGAHVRKVRTGGLRC